MLHLTLPPFFSSGKRLGEDMNSECGNGISDAKFLIVCYSNYGSVLLSFRDMITERTTNGIDGPTTATISYLALKVDRQYIAKV